MIAGVNWPLITLKQPRLTETKILLTLPEVSIHTRVFLKNEAVCMPSGLLYTCKQHFRKFVINNI